MADRTVAVSLVARVQGYVAGLSTAARATKQFGTEVDTLGRKSPKQFGDITNAAAGAGLALVAMAGYAVKAAADFDRQMSAVKSVAGATAAQMGQLRAAAIQAGKDTQYSATEAAQAETELAKAGVSASNILSGALRGSLSLAAAGQIDLADAATISAQAMNMFHLKGTDVGHIADVLAAAANTSASDIHGLSLGMQQAGNVAAAMGISLEDTTGALAAFADRGLAGSDAGTSFKTMLMRLQAPVGKAADLMRQLGLKAYDAQGNFVGLADFAGQLQHALGDMTQEQRNAALATIFGSDAIRSATIFYNLGSTGVKRYTDGVNQTGAAADTAATMTDNLAGDIERLKGSIETLAIQAGSGANGGLRTLVQMVGGMVDSFGMLPDGVQHAGVVISGLTGTATLAAVGWAKLRDKVRDAQDALEAMGPTGTKVSGVLGSVTSFTGKLVVTLGALQAASAVWASFGDQASPNMQQLNKDLIKFGQTGQAGGQAAVLFGKDLHLLKYDLDTTGTGFWAKFGNGFAGFVEGFTGTGQVFDESLTHAKARIGELDQALAAMVSSGHGDDAAKVFDRITQLAKAQGISVSDLKAALPTYAAALDGATASEQKSVAAAEQHTLQNQLLAGSLRDAIDAAGGLKQVFDQLNGAQLGVNETTIAAEKAVDDLTESIHKNHGALNLSTEAGRENQAALDTLATKAAEAAQAVYDQTGDVNAAASTFQHYKDALVNAYIEMGKTKAQAQALADQLMGLPQNIPITITTTYRTNGTPLRGNSRYGNLEKEARGGVVDYYAQGGENHTAQVAPAGTWRVWGEDETGGEGYIPLGYGKRGGAVATLGAINRRFGNPLGTGPAGPVNVNVQIRATGGTQGIAAMLQEMQRKGELQFVAQATG